MIDRMNEAAVSSNHAVRASRKPHALAVLALTSTLILAAAIALQARQYPNQPQGSTTARGSSCGDAFTIDQLGDALDSLGKNSINNNGDQYYSISANAGEKKLQVLVSLSPNGRIIWINADLATLPGNLSAAAMVNILKKNDELSPTFFTVRENTLTLMLPVANFNLSPESVRGYVKDFISTAKDTASLWDAKALAGR